MKFKKEGNIPERMPPQEAETSKKFVIIKVN